MRNLKKFLALVLAMIMAFSLMVTVNAATDSDFTDKEAITEEFSEGIEVLKGMGVFEGYADGSFQPKAQITRAEAATIVYRLATGDWKGTQAHLYKDYANFSDVPADHWAAGYINYCANAEWIAGYGDGRFGPGDNVTGYQAAAMILRAVGYGKNGEFTGPTWQVQVANVTRSEGLLDNVDDTTYAGTLNQSANRELVAEILFQAAQIPTVTWSMLGGYNKFQTSITVAGQDNYYNPSLGLKNYGLTYDFGIVVGNQATGEDATKIGFETNASDAPVNPGLINGNGSYTYTDTAASAGAAGNVTEAFDAETGLGLFGHRVKVWYDYKGGTHKSYAVFDKAVLSAVITASDSEQLTSTLAAADATKLSAAVKAAGFSLSTTAATFHESASFSRMEAAANDAPDATDAKVYVVISNNANKTVDVVIPVNCAATQISKVDNWSATKTIQLDTTLESFDVDAPESYEQDTITSDPAKLVVGSKVIATEISSSTKTNAADGSDALLWLDTVPQPSKTGKVVNFDAATGAVTLEGGEKLERTIIADAAIEPTVGNYNVLTLSSFKYTTYKFTLDGMGNWLHAEEVFENNFVYGTYLDYTTNLGTGTFTYQLVGVDMDGKVVKYNPTKYHLEGGTATEFSGVTAGDIKSVGIPYNDRATGGGLVKRDTDGASVTYKGFIMQDKLMDNRNASLKNIAGVEALTAAGATAINGTSTDLGVQMVTDSAANGSAAKPYVYLTEKTKFIVVDGYGTDTVKPVVYNGISALLGGSKSVTINSGTAGELLYTSSNFIYSNTNGKVSQQIDVMFLPKDALTYGGADGLFFFEKVATNVTSAGGDAYLFEAYQNGEKVNVWVSKDYVNSGTLNTQKVSDDVSAHTAKTFLFLVDSGEKAPDGQAIYTTKALSGSQNAAPATDETTICYDKSAAGEAYVAHAANAKSALLGDDTIKVDGAKVVNLVPDDATIESLNDLNHLASVGSSVKVSVVYAEAGSNTVSVIYVISVS